MNITIKPNCFHHSIKNMIWPIYNYICVAHDDVKRNTDQYTNICSRLPGSMTWHFCGNACGLAKNTLIWCPSLYVSSHLSSLALKVQKQISHSANPSLNPPIWCFSTGILATWLSYTAFVIPSYYHPIASVGLI